MNKDDIIRMAREAGFTTLSINEDTWIPYLDRFAGLVAAAEREACAKFIEDHDPSDHLAATIAAVIRSRGQG